MPALGLSEIDQSLTAKERNDARQRRILRTWFEELLVPGFAGHIIPSDLSAASALGSFRTPEHPPLDDVLIASIAVANTKTVATRNTKHFEVLEGVRLVDPWAVNST